MSFKISIDKNLYKDIYKEYENCSEEEFIEKQKKNKEEDDLMLEKFKKL